MSPITTVHETTRSAARPLMTAGLVSLALHGSVLAAASCLWAPATPPSAPPLVAVAVVAEKQVRPTKQEGHIAPAAVTGAARKTNAAVSLTKKERPPLSQTAAGSASNPNNAKEALVRPPWLETPPVPPLLPLFRLGGSRRPPRQVFAKTITPDPRTHKPPMIKSAPVPASADRAGTVKQTAEVTRSGSPRGPGPSRPVAGFGNPAPEYPWISRRRGEQGRVILEVGVTADGRAETIRISRSSGSARLDQAALASVKRWRFSPAMRGGRPVAGRIEVPISFRLTK